MLKGGCNCRAIRYQMPARAIHHHTLCHCEACRKASGAPASSWALVRNDKLKITGTPVAYESSPGTYRSFCGVCGTSLFYTNQAIFPDMTDVLSATLDDPDALPLMAQIQTAERLDYMASLDTVPSYERFPSED